MPTGNAVIIDVEADAVAPDDAGWARDNLRAIDGRPVLDIANCLRVIERHPDFKGRYRFNEVLVKVLDRGTVMVEWRVSEFVATLQERFLPEIPFDIAYRALVVAANRAGQK
jgi:citrate lyase beta subunit